MKTFELIAIKNEKSERTLIRKDEFDTKKHKKWDKSNPGNEEDPEEEKQYTFGNFEAQETEAKGWWEVINTETQERQNEKNLREDDAISLAKKLGE